MYAKTTKNRGDLMESKNCISNRRKYKHLNEADRCKIEVLLKDKKKVSEIATLLNRDRATIYREIKRGTVRQLDGELRQRYEYRADVAQRDYEEQGRNKERSLKIGSDKGLEEYIRKKLLKDKYSPDAIIGEIKAKGLEFTGMICAKTLYNYIDAGIFSGISNETLWEKRKRKKHRIRKIRVTRELYKMPRRITERPEVANNRLEYGHWEGDCIKGPVGTRASLLTLTERKSLEEIIIKLERATQENVKKAFDDLEKRYGAAFKIKFKSITFDNGSEFLNWKYLELSTSEPENPRTITYFAHPYSAWERGSNENQNRMIRRFIPKGTSIGKISFEEIARIEKWINNYPRKRLGYRSARDVAQEHMQNSGRSEFSLDFVAL